MMIHVIVLKLLILVKAFKILYFSILHIVILETTYSNFSLTN